MTGRTLTGRALTGRALTGRTLGGGTLGGGTQRAALIAGLLAVGWGGGWGSEAVADVFPDRRARTYGSGYVVSNPWNSSVQSLGRYGQHTPGYRRFQGSLGGLRRSTYLPLPVPARSSQFRSNFGRTLPRSSLRSWIAR